MEAVFWDPSNIPDIVTVEKSLLVLASLPPSPPLLPSCSSVYRVSALCQALDTGDTKTNRYFMPTFPFLMRYNMLSPHVFIKLSPPQKQFSCRCQQQQHQLYPRPLALQARREYISAHLSVPKMDKLHAPLALSEMLRRCWLPLPFLKSGSSVN